MDHDEVVRQKLTERYLLHELDGEARDAFEEHYFECSECAIDVRAGSEFVENSKIILALPSKAPSTARRAPDKPVRHGWFGWSATTGLDKAGSGGCVPDMLRQHWLF